MTGAWFRGLVAVAPIEPPEWMAAGGASSEDIADWEKHARAQLAADWRRRLSGIEHYPLERGVMHASFWEVRLEP